MDLAAAAGVVRRWYSDDGNVEWMSIPRCRRRHCTNEMEFPDEVFHSGSQKALLSGRFPKPVAMSSFARVEGLARVDRLLIVYTQLEQRFVE